jgi:hypothetical protein
VRDRAPADFGPVECGVHSRVLGIALACAALVAGGLFYFVSRQPSPGAGSEVARGAPSPAGAESPVEAPPAAVPAPGAGGAVRRTPAAAAAPPRDSAPALGTLHIDSDVAGAQVFLDRRFVGAAPVTATDVTPGTHQLNVQAEGFEGVAQTIEVEPGPRDIEVRLREVRLDASIAVEHKHRFGSCTGRLAATPQGLRYDTEHAEDAFSASLQDLETFQVDYLEKNLRVKLRGGRQFNFTDPGGDADRLFVFHRDVDNARERLARGDTPASD